MQHKYYKLNPRNKVNPKGDFICEEVQDNRPVLVYKNELDLTTFFFFDLEPLDKSGLIELDKIYLDQCYEGNQVVRRWWRE